MKKIILGAIIIAAVLTPMVLAASSETDFRNYRGTQNQLRSDTDSGSFFDYCLNEIRGCRRNSNNCGY